jgi:protein-disulfide isomerase
MFSRGRLCPRPDRFLAGLCAGLLACAASPPPDDPSAIDLTRTEDDAPPALTPARCDEVDEPGAHGCSEASAATPPKAPPPIDATVWRVPVGPDDPIRGPAHALVTLVIFSDFECPFCRRAAAVLEKLREVHAGEVRLVWKDYPLGMHERAEPAALLARAARAAQGDAGFWRAHDRLFELQPDLDDDALARLAGELGLEGSAVAEARASRKHALPLVLGRQLGARLEIDRTPTVFVNGRKVAGAPGYGTLDTLILEERAKAQALVDSGVPLDTLYESIVEDGESRANASDLP